MRNPEYTCTAEIFAICSFTCGIYHMRARQNCIYDLVMMGREWAHHPAPATPTRDLSESEHRGRSIDINKKISSRLALERIPVVLAQDARVC